MSAASGAIVMASAIGVAAANRMKISMAMAAMANGAQ